LINKGITCPHSNNYTDIVHQTRPILVRDLSIFGRFVYLKVPRRHFYCCECKKSPRESFAGLNNHQRQTNSYQEYIYERVTELTVEQVSQNESIGRDAVQSIFHKIAQFKKKTGECLNA
jgi:transposase